MTGNTKDCVKISDLHQCYLDWCRRNQVDVPVVKEVLGKVFKKMFGNLKTKSLMRQGDSAYYYTCLVYMDDDFRENKLPKHVKFAPYVSFEIEHDIALLYIPTTFIVNTEIQEYKVYMNLSSLQYHITFRDDELNLDALGIGEYSEFDQMFVNSVTRLCDAFVICQGKPIDLPLGKKASTNLQQLFIGRLGPNNAAEQITTSYYSMHCLRVLPLNGELKNRMCSQCVHDINQRIRQLASSGVISKDASLQLLKRIKLNVSATSSSDSTDKDNSIDISAEEPPKKKFKFQKGITKKQAEVQEVEVDEESEEEENGNDSGFEKEDDSEEEELQLKGGGSSRGGEVRYEKVSV